MQKQFEKLLHKQCPWYPNAKHSVIECYNLRRTFNAAPLDNNANKKGKGKEDEPKDKSGGAQFQDASKAANIIFGGESDFASKRAQKLTLRGILSIKLAVPRSLQWLQVPISFLKDDQWTSFAEPGKFPLVLDPVVASVRLTRVLIDEGSGHQICLNIPYAKSFIRITRSRIAALPVWAGDPDKEGEQLQGGCHQGSDTQGDPAAGGRSIQDSPNRHKARQQIGKRIHQFP
jgi:hypothetical protein